MPPARFVSGRDGWPGRATGQPMAPHNEALAVGPTCAPMTHPSACAAALVAIFRICLYREGKISSPQRKTGQTMATNTTMPTIVLISHAARW
jgi:hypothetical protein